MTTGSPTRHNIEEISKIEKESLKQRSAAERLGDSIASHAGRMWFIILHGLWFFLWIALDSPVFSAQPLDPYPFALLTMIVSLESIFLSLFILMSQNRAGRQADDRNHLDLQINLLSERENTKMLEMLKALCIHHGLDAANDPELKQLLEETKPRDVLDELRNNLPEHNEP